MKKITLNKHLYRQSIFYSFEKGVAPDKLFNTVNNVPDLSDFPFPLPCEKNRYCCCDKSDNGILWLGSDCGVTRIDPDAEFDFDRVMYFSADRDLPDNNVKAVSADGEGAWILTETGITHIEMIMLSPEDVAAKLLDETLSIVERQGMVSQRYLAKAGELDTALPHANSDNDGGFTALFSIAEIMRYACYKKEFGSESEKTREAKAVAVKALEACLLLMYIHGRGDGFIARTYLFDGEPVPDDGFFFKRQGNKAICVANSESVEKGVVGAISDCSAEVPERLRYLYEDKGKTLDDIIYKADTSSDEVTIQLLNCLFAHKYLTEDEPELDNLIKESVKGIVNHIIDNGFVLKDFHGGPTTWARWDNEYFNGQVEGWADAPLNAAEILFYLKTVMEITGEKGKWLQTYESLINEHGYADLTEKHFDRLYQMCLALGVDYQSEIMYGDHMLATCSFFGLCTMEKDEKLLRKYRKGYEAWRSSIGPEHNPGYDFLYALANPDDNIDMERIREWFLRFNLSRLASGVSLIGRHDVAVKELRDNYNQISVLLPPDERFISKYDRDPLRYTNVDSGGNMCVESCFVYTFAYWIGRYFGFIE
ncbi:MAG: hypothetical protein J5870_02105 [Clostridia bacterium]|nr:hypothetical protein [Clostridia bacterium]